MAIPTPRADIITQGDEDLPDSECVRMQMDAENIQKELDKEEAMDIAANQSFNSSTIDGFEDKLRRAGGTSVAPSGYMWQPRRSRSERVRHYHSMGDCDMECNTAVKRKWGDDQ